ncbi:hypothetical protein [Salinispora arenicola]|nr:hypothetical protein [Salinispora arenicola]
MCTACRVVLAVPGEAWCIDCAENVDPGDFVAGVHAGDELPDPDE